MQTHPAWKVANVPRISQRSLHKRQLLEMDTQAIEDEMMENMS